MVVVVEATLLGGGKRRVSEMVVVAIVTGERLRVKLAWCVSSTPSSILLIPSIDPRYVLSDNFAPLDELPPPPCQVIEVSLPPALDGAYIRNGPNPQFLPRGPYHLFDGDGMLHAITISSGRATLCSRYVQTYKYKIERQYGSPVLPNVFSGFNSLSATAARRAVAAGRILAGQYNPANGIGLANTSLALISGRLYAMGESDLPYAVRVNPNDGEIHTIGRHDFSGKLAMSMTAHPKIDPVTKETFAFRYGPMPPFLTYFTIDPNGEKRPDVPIFSMTSPSFLHDLARRSDLHHEFGFWGD
ncbi:putative carotenoid cleavage dioxygenase 4, chloroplastic [Castilleja foliolosa]|uniref:Carotenoid cleavage dioxygenase 4, chloroplastic n=1 Tax=Castilleja foliolosa TaxID=1961234 RepID=A0ABD3E727_9LAMI